MLHSSCLAHKLNNAHPVEATSPEALQVALQAFGVGVGEEAQIGFSALDFRTEGLEFRSP